MVQAEEEKAAAKEAEAAKKAADAAAAEKAAEETAKKDAERIAKEDEAKAEKAKAERAEKAELALQAQEAAEATGTTTAPDVATPAPVEAPEILVLSAYDIVEKNDDVYIYENIQLPATYKNEKGVKKFEGSNGQVIYYTQALVKKFSENVVTDGSTEEAPEE